MAWPNGNPGYSGSGTITPNVGPAPVLNQTGGPSFSFDLGAANAALKELYDDQKIQNLVYKNNPFLAMVPKMEEFGGKYMPIPLIINTSQGRSATFSNAQGNQTAATVESFALTRASNYSIAQIDNQTLLASKTDKMAFINGATVVIDGAIRALTNSLATQLFRSGSGTIGQVSAAGINASTGVITLTNSSDVVNFEVNMTLNGANTETSAPYAAPLYVVAVNRSAGTITVNTSMGGTTFPIVVPSGWGAGSYLFVQGDRTLAGAGLALKGLSGWIPTTAPTTGDNWFGVDRSVDPTRLAGVRFDGSQESIEEAVIDASLLVAREGGTPDVCIMNFASYAALEKSLGAKAQYISFDGPAKLYYPGILINGAAGQIRVFPDRSCTAKTAYLLQMDTWKLYSLGPAPHIAKYADGLEMLRVFNSDAAELRVVSYANLACNAPGFNAVVQLGA
jgi:hypothetical protein